MGINVLSLCDGMSCGQIALKELNIDVDNYYASEIDKNAIKVTQDNFPNTIQLGDVIALSEDEKTLKELPKIDLIMFGFPCRSLSNATAGRKEYNNGLKGVSGIFYNCLKIMNWLKANNNYDIKFLIENVNSNNKKDLNIVSELVGVAPVLINSNLFSAQDRERLYWTNVEIDPLPISCDKVLKDIMDKDVKEEYFYKQDFIYHGDEKKVCATLNIKGHDILKRVNNKEFKSPTLTSCRGGNTQKKVFDNGKCRKLTENEYRKLQTIPDWYIMNVAKSHIYNMCGDGWTIEVIKHILKNLK
jgi:site-specific DNA-cytosine methylase